VEIIIIAARSENHVIGKEGGLPWHIPAEEKHYHDSIRGHWGVVGRKSIATEKNQLPLAGLIILTRDRGYQSPPNLLAHSLQEALDMARLRGLDRLFILGGSEVYRQALPLTDRMILSEVKAEVEGEIYFPNFDEAEWKVESSESFPMGEGGEPGFEVKYLLRKKN
jgi:dihydrofolate reductase